MIDRNKVVEDFLESDDTRLLFYEDENGETQVKTLKRDAEQ